jgi:uncharacterized repeat protein (TIGR03803 family)
MFRSLTLSGKCILGCGLTLAMLGSLGGADANSKYEVLYSFGAQANDGANPQAGLIADSAGNLYGTTVNGGAGTVGTVFKLAPDGAETVLYSFGKRANDGANPYAGLIADSEGNLYGTTSLGGKGCGSHYEPTTTCGTVFKVTPKGKEKVLYSFGGGDDGWNPLAGLIMDRAGNLFGTTEFGGHSGCGSLNCGTVFELAPDGTERVLYAFTGGYDGYFPIAGVIADNAGNLYGATVASPGGIVFELTRKNKWAETALYHFCSKANCRDGNNPRGDLIEDDAGDFYGVTAVGGKARDCDGSGCGVVFKLTPNGGQTVLYSFCCSHGSNPVAGLIADSAGNLYGTTVNGGAANGGTVFKVTPNEKETVLYSFCSEANCTDGAQPVAGLIEDKQGNLYGATPSGGAYGQGAVFKVIQ